VTQRSIRSLELYISADEALICGPQPGISRTGVRPNSWPMFYTIICYYRALFCSFFIAQQCWHLIAGGAFYANT